MPRHSTSRRFACRGTVYGVLLNHRAALAALGDAVERRAVQGAAEGAGAVRQAAQHAGRARRARCASADAAASSQIGASARHRDRPHRLPRRARPRRWRIRRRLRDRRRLQRAARRRYYPPAVRFKARDGFCAHRRRRVVARADIATPMRSPCASYVDGGPAQRRPTPASTSARVARLLADVTDFMTLAPGDVLLLGAPHGAPRVARRRSACAIEIDGLGRLETPRRARRRSGRAMKRARVAYCRRDPRGDAARRRARCASPTAASSPRTPWSGCRRSRSARSSRSASTTPTMPRSSSFERAGRAAGVPEGPGRADRPPRPDAPPGRRHLHALRVRARGGDRQAGAQRRARPTRCSTSPATRSPTTTRFATTSRTGTGPNLRVKNRDGGTVLGPWLVDAADVAAPPQLDAAHLRQRPADAAAATRAT